MSEQTNADQGRFHSAVGGPSHPRLTSRTLGTACLVLASACIGLTFWTSDLALQSSATVLGLSFAASGLIALLAGDQ